MAAKNPFEAVKLKPDPDHEPDECQVCAAAIISFRNGTELMLAACLAYLRRNEDDADACMAADFMEDEAAAAGWTAPGHDSERGGKESVPERWPSALAEKGGS